MTNYAFERVYSGSAVVVDTTYPSRPGIAHVYRDAPGKWSVYPPGDILHADPIATGLPTRTEAARLAAWHANHLDRHPWHSTQGMPASHYLTKGHQTTEGDTA